MFHFFVFPVDFFCLFLSLFLDHLANHVRFDRYSSDFPDLGAVRRARYLVSALESMFLVSESDLVPVLRILCPDI